MELRAIVREVNRLAFLLRYPRSQMAFQKLSGGTMVDLAVQPTDIQRRESRCKGAFFLTLPQLQPQPLSSNRRPSPPARTQKRPPVIRTLQSKGLTRASPSIWSETQR